jgi:prophage maintenance system killer protein
MIATFVFLEMNGYRVEAPELEAYTMFIGLAAGEVRETELAASGGFMCVRAGMQCSGAHV